MNESKYFGLAIATIYGGTVFFNVYDIENNFKVIGFAAYNFKVGLITTDVKCEDSEKMTLLYKQITETARKIGSSLN